MASALDARAGTPTAPISGEVWDVDRPFAPPKWPVAAVLIVGLGAASGLWVHAANAPIGNRVALHVTPSIDDSASRTAAHAVHAELTSQLRALRLDVGGPVERAAIHIDVRVAASAHPTVAMTEEVDARIRLALEDHAFPDELRVHSLASGAQPAIAAARAGQRAAWIAVGKLAAQLADYRTAGSTLSRLSDGRGSVRLFAAIRADLVEGRNERLTAMHAARVFTTDRSSPLTSANEAARLMGPIDAQRALVVVEDRLPLVLPVSRNEPSLIHGLEHLEIRGAQHSMRLFSADHFTGRAIVDEETRFAAVAVGEADGTMALCRVSLETGGRTCRPVGEPALVEPVAIGSENDGIIARVRDCFSGCPERLVWWHPSSARLLTASLGGVTSVQLESGVAIVQTRGESEQRYQWTATRAPRLLDGNVTRHPTGARANRLAWMAWLSDDVAVALVEEGSVPRRRLALVHRARGVPEPLTHNVGDERHPLLAPDHSAVFYEVEHPDPDIAASWSEVRRLSL